jgi:hypothetical protein
MAPPTTFAPAIPFGGSYSHPLAHCSVRQVKRLLLGFDLNPFRGEDGSLSEFDATLFEDIIPDASGRAVRYMRTNYDWSREVWFFAGAGSTTLVLPRRHIVYVNAVFLRVLPSMMWYRFARIRNIDGTEFARIGGIEPPPALPETIPPTENSGTPYYSPTIYTGTEDADLFLDGRRRTLTIPPRVIAANVATPFYNFNFFRGQMNVEVHFAYGYPPTEYTDRQPLAFDPISGVMAPTSPASGELPGGAPVDWSSGMPADLSKAVARIAYSDILRRAQRSISGGLTSMSVDGASESYDSKYLDADGEEERAFKALDPFAIRML